MYSTVKEFLAARDALLAKSSLVASIGAPEFTPEEQELVKVFRTNLLDIEQLLTEENVASTAMPDIPLPKIAKYIFPERFVARSPQEAIIDATQRRLDDFARTRNYDGILSACTYATSLVPKFAAEGQYAVQARDTTWAALYALLARVQAGEVPAPASFDDVVSLLPTLEWPV